MLHGSIKASHLTKFSWAMRISGYNHKYRYELINGIITRYKQIEEQVMAGERLWYRDRDQILKQKLKNGGLSAATWHLSQAKGITQTLFMPITPDSELTKQLRKSIGDYKGPDGGRTVVVEQGGVGIKQISLENCVLIHWQIMNQQ